MTDNERYWLKARDEIIAKLDTIGDVDLLDIYVSYVTEYHLYLCRDDSIQWTQKVEDIMSETVSILRMEIFRRMERSESNGLSSETTETGSSC